MRRVRSRRCSSRTGVSRCGSPGVGQRELVGLLVHAPQATAGSMPSPPQRTLRISCLEVEDGVSEGVGFPPPFGGQCPHAVDRHQAIRHARDTRRVTVIDLPGRLTNVEGQQHLRVTDHRDRMHTSGTTPKVVVMAAVRTSRCVSTPNTTSVRSGAPGGRAETHRQLQGADSRTKARRRRSLSGQDCEGAPSSRRCGGPAPARSGLLQPAQRDLVQRASPPSASIAATSVSTRPWS